MDIKRNNLIVFLLGYYIFKYPNGDPKDFLIHVDNHLTSINNPPTTKEEQELIGDLHDELWLSLKLKGYNREKFRDVYKRK